MAEVVFNVGLLMILGALGFLGGALVGGIITFFEKSEERK